MTDRPIGLLSDGRETLTRDDHLMRAATILQRENGAWKVVHPHTSLGVPNAEVPAFADNP